jgi:hypothetical protein
MTTFAKGLAAGTIDAPAKTSWWPRHTRAMMRYLALSGMKTPQARAEIAANMQKGAQEFEDMVPKAAKHGLMIEHVALEIALVDAVRLNREKDIDGIGKKLFANTHMLSAALGIAVVEFPEEQFKRLFMDHVSLYAGSVRKKIEGVVTNSSEIDCNMLQLADFTAEWF